MTIYLLITAGRVIDDTSRFYFLYVTSSLTDKKHLMALSTVAASRQWYLAPRNNQAHDMLFQIASSLCKSVRDLHFVTGRIVDVMTNCLHLTACRELQRNKPEALRLSTSR